MHPKKSTLALLFLLFSLSFFTPLHAHTDHVEIQVKSKLNVNQQQQIGSISMVWLYDTFSSTDMLSHENDLKRLAKVLMSDLARFNYYTRLKVDDRRLVANSISNYSISEAKDAHSNPALQLSFTLVFKKPIDIKSLAKLSFDHADITGRRLFFYDKAEDMILTNELKSKCRSQLRDKAEFKEGEYPQIAEIHCRT